MESNVSGIHHITAITGDPQHNIDFYAGVLGLRLVKKTVNFDVPDTYHFYYGDDLGRPGTILTFFSWPGYPRGRRGSGQATTISFAIRGFHTVTLSVTGLEATKNVLTELLGFRTAGEEGNRTRYEVGNSGNATLVDVLTVPEMRQGVESIGTVHHVAWRTANDNEQLEWRQKVAEAGLNVTPVMDRTYFHSIYFREPGGVLFEIATDQPGFALDEVPEELGTHLKLPPWLEEQRPTLEHDLPPVSIPGV